MTSRWRGSARDMASRWLGSARDMASRWRGSVRDMASRWRGSARNVVSCWRGGWLGATSPWRTASRLVSMLLAVATVCWLGGFLWFVNITRQAAVPPPHTDGIVALTGGAGRVNLAFHLLASGQADKLLLSGIGGNTDLATLGRFAEIDMAPFAPQITLGRYAASTRGNAVETASWVRQNRIRSLIVVTAAYHMPRALTELKQTLPDVRLFPLPVRPGTDPPSADRLPGWRLQSEEYTKYLLAASGLSAWLPQREPRMAQIPPAEPGTLSGGGG